MCDSCLPYSLLTASLRDSDAGGDGLVEAPELLSPPSSPRQRYHTFGATLDFIEVPSAEPAA